MMVMYGAAGCCDTRLDAHVIDGGAGTDGADAGDASVMMVWG